MERAGSTAVVCLIVGNTLYTCNCGDSSAVLLGSGADKELEATGGAWRGKVALDFARKYKKLAVMKLLSPAEAPPLNHNHYFID